jgi:hypothetical protein
MSSYPRPHATYSLLPAAQEILKNKASSLGLSASRLLELVLLGKIESPFSPTKSQISGDQATGSRN